jgi:KDO2-lipid IV(A) lauroyltransferase
MLRWFRFFSHWPLWALHALGGVGGWLAWIFSATYRRRFLDNAQLAGLGWRTVLGAVGQAGRMTAELPRLWLGRTPRLVWADDRAAAQAYAHGQGVLFLTPHMGCFEITAQALALRFGAQHGQLTVLYRPARYAALNEVMALARNRPGLQAVPTTLAGVRQMIKALRAGEAVGLLPDQVPP